jgi:hypothetical protein
VLQTVGVIFEDPGVQDLLAKVYQKGNFFSIWVTNFCHPLRPLSHFLLFVKLGIWNLEHKQLL